MARPTLQINFSDFWPGFDKTDNWIWALLSERFDLELCDQPKIHIYSCYGRDYLAHSCTRLFVSHENRGWGYSQCDWAITSDYVSSSRHLRVPLWATMVDANAGSRPDTVVPIGERGFAATVVSNGRSQTRERVHGLLDTYREVASGGRHRNNVGGPVADKQAFVRKYKFALAFENSSYPGYTTEKLLHALQADTVPIYWGDPLVSRDFNPRRFVNYHDYPDEDALLQRIIELDQDDDLYSAMLAEPWFNGNVVPECANGTRILDFVQLAANDERTPVARRRWRPDTLARRLTDRLASRRRFLGRVT